MTFPGEDYEVIKEELQKFFRKSDVHREDTENGTIFIVDSYVVRREGVESKCRVALLLQGKAREVLVEQGYEHVKKYLTGHERKKDVSGTSWFSIPIANFWDPQRPAYWFLERNLTKFFIRN